MIVFPVGCCTRVYLITGFIIVVWEELSLSHNIRPMAHVASDLYMICSRMTCGCLATEMSTC